MGRDSKNHTPTLDIEPFLKKISMRKKNLLSLKGGPRALRCEDYEKEKVYFLSMMLVYLLNVKMVCGDYEKFVNKM